MKRQARNYILREKAGDNLTNACDMEELLESVKSNKNSCTVHFMDLPIRMHMIF